MKRFNLKSTVLPAATKLSAVKLSLGEGKAKLGYKALALFLPLLATGPAHAAFLPAMFASLTEAMGQIKELTFYGCGIAGAFFVIMAILDLIDMGKEQPSRDANIKNVVSKAVGGVALLAITYMIYGSLALIGAGTGDLSINIK
jgi:hypothetical protein